TLVCSKSAGWFLELGTGTGLSLSWIVDAVDNESSVISIDNDSSSQLIAQRFFGGDSRVHFLCIVGNKWITENKEENCDLIFADAWPGKYSMLYETFG